MSTKNCLHLLPSMQNYSTSKIIVFAFNSQHNAMNQDPKLCPSKKNSNQTKETVGRRKVKEIIRFAIPCNIFFRSSVSCSLFFH